MWCTIQKYTKILRSNISEKVGGTDELEYRKNSKSREDLKIEHETECNGKNTLRIVQKIIYKTRGTKSWHWLKKGCLKKEIKKKIIVAQVEAMFANNIKEAVYGKHVSPLCQLCGGGDERWNSGRYCLQSSHAITERIYKDEKW